MPFPVLFWIILHKVGLRSCLSISPDAKADLKVFFDYQSWPEYFPQKENRKFGSSKN